jgi:uncharacterized protein YecE (DUF72 family)
VTLLIGTSGWQYASWRERFYPPGLPQRRWLEHYAESYATVEVNSTFYNLPSEATVQRWADAAPHDFQFVLKASRYLTHIRRLQEPEGPVDLLLERARPLGTRLACVLVQLPPGFTCDVARLERSLRAFGGRVPVAVEFRDGSWYTEPVRDVLREHGAALCIADRKGRHDEPPWRTASWAYIRFHEGDGRPYPCYRPATMRAWAERLEAMQCAAAFVFFNNDPLCCAPRDAARLAEACRERGMTVSRAPDPRAMHPG